MARYRVAVGKRFYLTRHRNEMLQNWSVAARSVSPGPHFSQGRLRVEEPLRYWQLTVTRNELYYSTYESEILATYCRAERTVLQYL